MIVLEVKLNGELITTAGRDDLCVLNTIVDAIGVLGTNSAGTKTEKDGYILQLHVGGLGARSDEEPGRHFRWVPNRDISLGDEVTIRILESDSANEPIVEKPKVSKLTEKEERARWQSARDYYLRYKDKYENNNG